MRIAAAGYTPYVQRSSRPSFGRASKSIMDYMKPKGYDNLPPMNGFEKGFLAIVPPVVAGATAFILATHSSACHLINMCLGKY